MPSETFLGFTEEERTYKPVVHKINLLETFESKTCPRMQKLQQSIHTFPRRWFRYKCFNIANYTANLYWKYVHFVLRKNKNTKINTWLETKLLDP